MNVLIGAKKLSCFLALLIIPNFCYANKGVYKPPLIADVETVKKDGGNLKLSDREVEFTVSYQLSSSGIDRGIYSTHSPENIRYVMKDSWGLLKGYLRSKGVPYEDCRQNYNIHIFVVNNSVLSDTDRFSLFFKRYGIYPTNLLGYYDSTLEIDRNSIILISKVNYHDNNALLAHELSHYWWDRMCLGEHFGDGSESFADQFQEYYEAQR